MFGIEATTKPLFEKPVSGTQNPRLLPTPFTLEPTMRPASNTPDPWSPLRLIDNLPSLHTFEPFAKKLPPNTTAPTHVGKPPHLPITEPFVKKLPSNTTAPTHVGKPPPLRIIEPFVKKLPPNTTAPTHVGKPSPLPIIEPFVKKLAPNATAPTHVGKPSPLPIIEPFVKKLAPNATAPTHVGKPSPLPIIEPFVKKLASNTTASIARHYNKLLDQFTFNPDSKKLASNTSLFHFTPFKPINDWKPFQMPDFKPKLHARPPARTAAAVHKSGPLVIAKAIAGLSGCILIMMLIFCCIFSKRINRTRGVRRPRRNDGLPSWYCGSEPIDMGDDPPRYSYTNPEDTETQNYNQEIDVALEMGTELSLDLNSCDNDTGGTSNDCVQD